VVTAETAALAVPIGKSERVGANFASSLAGSGRRVLVVLNVFVLYPVAMLLLGALTNTNPVREWVRRVRSVDQEFSRGPGQSPLCILLHQYAGRLRRPARPLAVGDRLTFSWIVVRTNTPWRRFIGARACSRCCAAAAVL